MSKEDKAIDLLLVEHRVLFTPRLTLRPVTLDDTKDIFEYTSSPSTTKFVTFGPHKDIFEAKKSVASYFMKTPLGKYALHLYDANKVIGAINIRVAEESNSGEIGYILNEKWQGQGYMTEACQRILKLAFETLKLDNVQAFVNKDNMKSKQVLNRLGMKIEAPPHEMYWFKQIKGQAVEMEKFCISK